MARLVDATLEAIRTVDPAAIEDAILMALSIYVKSAGGRLGEPLCSEMLNEEATEQDILELRNALVNLVAAHPLEDYARTAVFVLGHWEDPTLTPTFVEFMKLNHDNGRRDAVQNAMCALDHLGEDVFPWEDGRKYFAYNEFERNHQLAVRYLKKRTVYANKSADPPSDAATRGRPGEC